MDTPQHSFKSLGRSYLCIDLENDRYPKRVKMLMGKHAPKHLYVMGNLELLNSLGLGFCGSRKSSYRGVAAARDCAEQAVNSNLSVISGNAMGIDFEVHFTSLKLGGTTILVLPEGINHFRIKKSLSEVWDWNRVLVISQFEPDESWKVFRAMTRNQLIIALSRAMIVIEAGESGGTLSAGMDTLKIGAPLFVVEYQQMEKDAPGNSLLLSRGGQRLGKNKITNRANMSKVIEKIRMDEPKNIYFKQKDLF